MKTENLIEYLNQIKPCIPVNFITGPIDEIIKKLQEGEKYKKIVEEVERFSGQKDKAKIFPKKH